MKFYVESGAIKDIITAEDSQQAARMAFLNAIRDSEDGTISHAMITNISEVGFVQGFEPYGEETYSTFHSRHEGDEMLHTGMLLRKMEEEGLIGRNE